MAFVITAITVALAATVGIAFGAAIFACFAVTLPAPLVILWLSSDVVRADERGTA